jgi:hypothetical protein
LPIEESESEMSIAPGDVLFADRVRKRRLGRPPLWPAAMAALLALTLAPWPAGAAGAGEPPPSRLRLVRPAVSLVPGREASLVIQTVGERGERLAAQHPLTLTLSGAAGITPMTRVVVPAGSSEVSVPIRAAKPGLWQVEARGQGLYSTSTVIACVAEALLQHHQALAARGVAAPAAPAGGVVPAPVPRVARPAPATAARPAPRTAARTTAALRMAAPEMRPSRAPDAGAAGPASDLALPPPPPPAPAGVAPPRGAAAAEIERLRVAGPAAAPKGAAAGATATSAAAGEARPGSAAPLGTARLAAGKAVGPAAAAVPGAAAGEGAAAGTSGAGGSGGAGVSGGVRLIPERLERHRGSQGWESVAIDAYWYEKGNPGPAPHDLDLALVSAQGDLRIDPARLNIRGGDFVSTHPAVVTPAAAETASLQALYAGGQSNRVEMSFLAAPAARLSFSSGPQLIHAFGVASSDVYVRLLDAAGEPAVTDQPVKISLQLSGPIGSPQLPPAVINAGEIQTQVPLQLPRFGVYTIVASAPNLADASPLTIEVAFDWLLLLATLLGGLLGSLTRVLYQGQREAAAPRRLLRVLLLGGLAALLVVLLSAFGLLSLLAGALPESWTQALARLPLGSLTGVFLLGFLAGLLFDRVFGGLVSPAGREKGAVAPPAADEG